MKYSHPDRPRYGTARSDAPANARDATSGPSSRQLRCERPALCTQRYDAYAPAIRAHEIEDSRTNGGGSSCPAPSEQQSMPLMASFVHKTTGVVTANADEHRYLWIRFDNDAKLI